MGEKKPLDQKYEPIRDDVNGKLFSPGCVRQCPEPHVIKRFGIGGKCMVSVYTCRKCKYTYENPWTSWFQGDYVFKVDPIPLK